MSARTKAALLLSGCVLLCIAGCSEPPAKRYYTLNYVAGGLDSRLRSSPYPFTIRVRDLDIEEAYARPQIVYRKSPFQLEYYFYRVWAVKPSRMLSDLLLKHLVASELVGSVVRRFDEGVKPQYEIGGTIEAIEEYDSDEIWFAHVALHLRMTRLSDGRVIYNRRFDNRKRVYQNQPEYVVREMSAILEYVYNQVVRDLDAVFARELGMSAPAPAVAEPDSVQDTPEIWQ
jgi:ABC-type uncharacterized transport system auxiliary subunit